MNREKVDFYTERDILGQEVQYSSVGRENNKNPKQTIDHTTYYKLPSIRIRYFSTLIDVIVILGLSLGFASFFEILGEVPDYVRGITFLFVFILYEPLLVSFACTVGQFLTNIRVRSFNNADKKLKLHFAILRTLVKATLGWISLLTITFNKNRLAIPDFLSRSIVIIPYIDAKPN